MKIDAQNRRPRRRWQAALAILVIILSGLLFGAGVILLKQNPPFERRSTARLMRDLRKTDSLLDHLQQTLWLMMPSLVTERFSRLPPMPANDVRRFAAIELKGRAPASVEAVPALVLALHDPDSGVRGWVLEALARFGQKAKPAMTEVLLLLDDPMNAVLRSQAVKTLVAIAQDDPQVRARLLFILRERPPPPASANPASARITASQDEFRHLVLKLLDKLDLTGNEVVTVLLHALSQASDPLAVEIIGKLGSLGPITPEIIPALIEKLRPIDAPAPAGVASIAESDRAQQDADPGAAAPVFGDDTLGLVWARDGDVISAALRALERLARSDNQAVPMLIAATPRTPSLLT